MSTQSVFTSVELSNLSVTNEGGSVPGASASGGSVVVIANQSLLGAQLGSNKQRLFTLYGKADTNYIVNFATNLAAAAPWIPVLTNTLPASSSKRFVIQAPWSNAPALFIRAVEK